MKYDAVIWDIDGTLLHTAEGLCAAYRHCIETLRLPMRSDAALASYIGPVPQEVFRREFGLGAEDAQSAADMFRAWYKENGLRLAYPYPGIPNVLRQVQGLGLRQAVATNKRQDYALEICRIFGISAYCSPILGPDNVSSKTKADLICECLAALQVERAIMIGDTPGDAAAAAKAGVAFLGVNYGFGFHGVAGYVDRPEDILKFLM